MCTRYGGPDVLQLEEVDKPTPKDNEVLVEVHAASVNAADVETLRGVLVVRIGGPLRPRYKILGSDIAGRVEAVGREVKNLKPGDEVYADLFECGFGAFAEYVSVPEDVLAPKPVNMTFEQAATIPQAAILALQHLRDRRQIQPGEKVVIVGAGGGVGTFAVQIAKHFGAEVTGVDSARKLEMLRSIGADHVIDYTQEDFTKSGELYDVILAIAGCRSIMDYLHALSPKGLCAYVGGSTAQVLQALFLAPVISMTGSRKMGIVMWKPNKKEDLCFLEELFEAGEVVPVIDRSYPLGGIPEAFRYLESGQALGKLTVTFDHHG